MIRRFLHVSSRSALAIRVPSSSSGARSSAPGSSRGRPARRGRQPKLEEVAPHVPGLAQIIKHGLRDMDVVVDLSQDKQTISIDPSADGAPTFLLHPAPEDNTKLYFTSGGSQSWRYSWDSSEECFKADDGHDLLGMISREILWFAQGLPKF